MDILRSQHDSGSIPSTTRAVSSPTRPDRLYSPPVPSNGYRNPDSKAPFSLRPIWYYFLSPPSCNSHFPFSFPLTLVALRTTTAAWPVLQWRPTHAQCVALIDRCEGAPAIWCSVTVYAVATGSYNVDCYITTWSGYLTNIAQWTRGLLAHHKQQ